MVSMIVTGILVVFTIVMDAVICWIMYFNKIDNSKEIWKFKFFYRVFCPVWYVGMAIISFIQIENGYMGVFLIITCLIANLLPLYNLKEFLANLLLGIMVIIGLVWSKSDEGLLVSTRMEIACFVAMQVIGYLAQRMQLMLWMSREYLYIEAFIDPLTELLNRLRENGD